jgi:response regulator NasT
VSDEHYKVLLANADKDELRALGELVEAAGHEVVALAITSAEAGNAIIEHSPSMAMILVEGDEDHALELMVEIRSFADIPLVILARSISDDSLRRAADQAMEILHVPGTPETVARVVEVAAKRYEERRGMERQLGEMDSILERRSAIEQAKGILMERHAIDQEGAFAMLRSHSQRNGRKLIDVAAAVVESHLLLLPGPRQQPPATSIRPERLLVRPLERLGR